jgi:hypothetical protein
VTQKPKLAAVGIFIGGVLFGWALLAGVAMLFVGW